MALIPITWRPMEETRLLRNDALSENRFNVAFEKKFTY